MPHMRKPKQKTPRVTALDLDQAELTPEIATYFTKCEEKIGFIPNVLLAYAHDMAKLEAFAAMYNNLMLAPSGLSKLEREIDTLFGAVMNHCFYCLTAHGAAVRQLSGRPELGEALAMNYRAIEHAPRLRAMLDFAVKITNKSAEIAEKDREKLRKHEFSDADIWDIAAVAAFFNMSNRMASAVDMRPNPEYHAQAR